MITTYKFMSSTWRFITIIIIYSVANADNIRIFPLQNYTQSVDKWINPKSPTYDTPLISTKKQNHRFDKFKNQYFYIESTSKSPWNGNYIKQILSATGESSLLSLEQQQIKKFTKSEIYGENFRLYPASFMANLTLNMDINRLASISYAANYRAIAVKNLMGRILPSEEPVFYNYKKVGEGYPFDNLQQSVIWVGTPLYVLIKTKDKSWSLVQTPDFTTWVKSDEIALTDNIFIKNWESSAIKSIGAIIKTTSIIDSNGIFRFNAYIGSVFPSTKGQILIPVADVNGNAVIKTALVNTNNIADMPLKLTPHNLSIIISNLIGRTYGWGNMYNYNDCSAELKSLFTPFGIYLDRDSYLQINAGKIVDLSKESAKNRKQYLLNNGHPMVTLIRIPGHIVLYLGNFANPNSPKHEQIAMSYQSVWGLHSLDNSYRAVIGGSVFLPLLDIYPEDLNLASFYDEKAKTIFQLSYLDE